MSRPTHHTRRLRLIAIGSALVLALAAVFASAAGAIHIPTPSKAKSTQEMELALRQEFGRQFTKSTHKVDCNHYISRTAVRCAVDFRYRGIVWTGHGRIWRAVCNGSDGISKNHHHTCWFVNWRLKRLDRHCLAEPHHSVADCTEPVVLH